MIALAAPADARRSRQRPLRAILWGGLFAGIFDISQAFIGFGLLGAKPFKILQHIAGGILGARSNQMGRVSAALGLMCHFTIAFTAASVYYLASRKLRTLVEHAVAWGYCMAKYLRIDRERGDQFKAMPNVLIASHDAQTLHMHKHRAQQESSRRIGRPIHKVSIPGPCTLKKEISPLIAQSSG